MKQYDDKAEEALHNSSEKARVILEDEEKAKAFVDKLEKKQANAHFKDALAYIPLLISLIRSYIRKEYTEIPVASIVAVAGALLYWLAPVDMIPDFIPGIGWLDDAAVVATAIALIKTDLDTYKKWLKEQGREV